MKIKRWQLLATDQFLLQKEVGFFRNAPFVNVYVWKEKLRAAVRRGVHLHENKSGDIRNFMLHEEVEESPVISIIPTQIMHRKCKRRRKPVSSVRKDLGRPTSARTKFIQRKITFVGRTLTAPDTSLGLQVK